MAPDTAFYSSLIMVAGKGGRVDVAHSLHDEMQGDELKPCQASGLVVWGGATTLAHRLVLS